MRVQMRRARTRAHIRVRNGRTRLRAEANVEVCRVWTGRQVGVALPVEEIWVGFLSGLEIEISHAFPSPSTNDNGWILTTLFRQRPYAGGGPSIRVFVSFCNSPSKVRLSCGVSGDGISGLVSKSDAGPNSSSRCKCTRIGLSGRYPWGPAMLGMRREELWWWRW